MIPLTQKTHSMTVFLLDSLQQGGLPKQTCPSVHHGTFHPTLLTFGTTNTHFPDPSRTRCSFFGTDRGETTNFWGQPRKTTCFLGQPRGKRTFFGKPRTSHEFPRLLPETQPPAGLFGGQGGGGAARRGAAALGGGVWTKESQRRLFGGKTWVEIPMDLGEVLGGSPANNQVSMDWTGLDWVLREHLGRILMDLGECFCLPGKTGSGTWVLTKSWSHGLARRRT